MEINGYCRYLTIITLRLKLIVSLITSTKLFNAFCQLDFMRLIRVTVQNPKPELKQEFPRD